jgi:energy-coupling factor transporter ATP-binding protein EcfA2
VPVTGRITDPSRVFDRERELRHSVEFVQAGSSVALIGPTAVGKSSLLTKLLTTLPERLGDPWETAYLDMQPIFNEDEFFTALCDVLGVDTCRGYPLHRALRGRRILLALDEVDKMAWEGFSRGLRAELRGLAGDATAPLRLLMTARVPLDQLFRDSAGATSPMHNICVQVNVERWDEDTAYAFLRHRLRGTGVTFTEEEMKGLIEKSHGHPRRLALTAYRLFARKTGGDG